MQGISQNMTSIYIISDSKMLLLYRIGSRVVQPSWCGIGGHIEKDMPFTVDYVLKHYFSTGRFNDVLYCGVARQDGVSFTELNDF